jgi:hypothetical protein
MKAGTAATIETKVVDLGKIVGALSLITALYATTMFVFMSYIGQTM